MTKKQFLGRVYDLSTPDETRSLYNEWAQSYDAEVSDNGYATPRRAARALASQCADPAAPILDFGCGTGLSGLALKATGFTCIDGADLSPQMLQEAAAKGVYRNLRQVEAGVPLPVTPGDYMAITAIGVIGIGAAPISVFDLIMNALAPGGLFAFSYNDHALAQPEYSAKLQSFTDAGKAAMKFQEHGTHLPGINLKSTVYVIEKT